MNTLLLIILCILVAALLGATIVRIRDQRQQSAEMIASFRKIEVRISDLAGDVLQLSINVEILNRQR